MVIFTLFPPTIVDAGPTAGVYYGSPLLGGVAYKFAYKQHHPENIVQINSYNQEEIINGLNSRAGSRPSSPCT